MRTIVLLTAMTFVSLSTYAQTDSIKVKEVVISTSPSDSTVTFMKVDIEASINPQLWRRHLVDALQPFMQAAVKRGIPSGTYIVQVKFLIERDGSISDVSALNDPGYGLARGAVEVVKTGPKWTPGIQNGQKVRSYRTQPITYVFTEK